MNRPHIIGVTVSDTAADTAIASVIVTANSWNSRPMMPPMKVMGMNTATSDSEIDTTVNPICRAPSNAAWSGDLPMSRWRMMFSIITIASSTTKPTDTVSAISVKLLSENPQNHIAASVPARDSGTVTPAARVGTRRRMNSATTPSTSTTEIPRLVCTSLTEARIVAVRSDRMVRSISGGIQLCSSGSTARTLSTVSITLAPAALVIDTNIAGLLPKLAASRALAVPSITRATLDSRTTAPPAVLITRGA